MNISEFDNLIPKEISTPECPTDKFVAGFLAQMDADLVANKPVKSNHLFRSLSAIAAAVVLVAGVSYFNRDIVSGIFFNGQKNKEIVAHITPEAETQYIYGDSEIAAEDAFASQLIGYDDASPATVIEKVSIQ